jgi:hypothetical protein
MRGGVGRTRTSNQAVVGALSSPKNSLVIGAFAAVRGPFVLVKLCRSIDYSLVGPRGCPECLRRAGLSLGRISLAVARTVYLELSRQLFHAAQSIFLVAA